MHGLAGEGLRHVAQERLQWSQGIEGQIIDTDIDGLLTAALCHETWGWPVVGFYDTHTLWLSADIETPLDLSAIAWVDLDMTWPGTLSISNHVIPHAPAQGDIPTLATSVNPSVLRGITTDGSYYSKYPFGTFQWLWWVLDKPVADARLDTEIGQGLAWMPDGGFESMLKYDENLRAWGSSVLPGSLLSSLLESEESREAVSHHAEDAVKEARRHLSHSHDRGHWSKSHQWGTRLPVNVRESPIEKEYMLRAMQGILDRICNFYDWQRLALPDRYRDYYGQHQRQTIPEESRAGRRGWCPPGWPISSHRNIVSTAATGRWAGSWTMGYRSDEPHYKDLVYALQG